MGSSITNEMSLSLSLHVRLLPGGAAPAGTPILRPGATVDFHQTAHGRLHHNGLTVVGVSRMGLCLFSAACRIHRCASAIALPLPLLCQLLRSLPAHSLQTLEKLCCHGDRANHIIRPLYFADRSLHGVFVMTLSSFGSIFCACTRAHVRFLHSISPLTSVRWLCATGRHPCAAAAVSGKFVLKVVAD